MKPKENFEGKEKGLRPLKPDNTHQDLSKIAGLLYNQQLAGKWIEQDQSGLTKML